MRRDVQGRGVAVLPLVALLSVLGACSGGGSDSGGTDPADPLAPHGLAYSHNPVEYVRGVPIPENTPSTTSGDAVQRYDAALPKGLDLNHTTGVITGTPTEVGEKSYTASATNDHGTATVRLDIKVREPDHYVISGRLIGRLPENAVMEVTSASGSPSLGRATPDANGYWFREGATTGAWQVKNVSAYAQITPEVATVSVGTSNVSGVDFYVAPASDRQSICSIVPDSTTATMGGPCVPFQAVLVNWATSTLADVKLEISIEQNKKSAILGTPDLACAGATTGTLAHGVCKVSGKLCVPAASTDPTRPPFAGPARLNLVAYVSGSQVGSGIDINLQ